MKVLIIDDAVDLNNTIQKILVYQNYEAESAYDGKSGLRKALSNEYDIILLDIMMPQMNGYDVLKNLRKEGRETPVILITAKLICCFIYFITQQTEVIRNEIPT